MFISIWLWNITKNFIKSAALLCVNRSFSQRLDDSVRCFASADVAFVLYFQFSESWLCVIMIVSKPDFCFDGLLMETTLEVLLLLVPLLDGSGDKLDSTLYRRGDQMQAKAVKL